jgi:anthranilate phosphoribosyltransferase
MKRETEDENLGALDALQAANCRKTVAIPDLIEITDPFNGVERHLLLTPFLAPILAACGLPAVIHGCADVGPKHGVTPREVLTAAGIQLPGSVDDVVTRLESPDLGWSYLDLEQSCPALERLHDLRELIVKRPCLSTLEKIMRPLHATERTHLLCGYVHKDYPDPMLTIAAAAGYASALVLRGTEGTVMPPLARGLDAAFLHTDGDREIKPLVPADFGIDSTTRFLPAEVESPDRSEFRRLAAERAAEAGLAVLNGETGDAADLLTLPAAAALQHVRGLSATEAASRVRDALASGAARARLK